jgi:hypothetical protein
MTVRWRDVLHLQIRDDQLRQRVEGFLDRFERGSFPYRFRDAQTGQEVERALTGQDILQRIQALGQQYNATAGANDTIRGLLNQFGIQHVNGRFTIADHPRPFDGNPANGSNTMFVGNPPSLPLAIQIGQQYLRGAQYLGVDGRHHPVTVDGVIAHELAHLAFLNPSESPRPGTLSPNQVESIVVTALGGPQRDPRTTLVRYTPDSNGGYQTLYDRQPQRRGSLQLYQTESDLADASSQTIPPIQLASLQRPRSGPSVAV